MCVCVRACRRWFDKKKAGFGCVYSFSELCISMYISSCLGTMPLYGILCCAMHREARHRRLTSLNSYRRSSTWMNAIYIYISCVDGEKRATELEKITRYYKSNGIYWSHSFWGWCRCHNYLRDVQIWAAVNPSTLTASIWMPASMNMSVISLMVSISTCGSGMRKLNWKKHNNHREQITESKPEYETWLAAFGLTVAVSVCNGELRPQSSTVVDAPHSNNNRTVSMQGKRHTSLVWKSSTDITPFTAKWRSVCPSRNFKFILFSV